MFHKLLDRLFLPTVAVVGFLCAFVLLAHAQTKSLTATTGTLPASGAQALYPMDSLLSVTGQLPTSQFIANPLSGQMLPNCATVHIEVDHVRGAPASVRIWKLAYTDGTGFSLNSGSGKKVSQVGGKTVLEFGVAYKASTDLCDVTIEQDNVLTTLTMQLLSVTHVPYAAPRVAVLQQASVMLTTL